MNDGGEPHFSSRVITYVPGTQGNQLVLVRAPRKPYPKLWNFPGGKKEAGETPVDTAIRELEQETGLRVEEKNMVPCGKVLRDGYPVYIFGTYVFDTSSLKDRGATGEEVCLFNEKLFPLMDDFVPENKGLLEIARQKLLKTKRMAAWGKPKTASRVA